MKKTNIHTASNGMLYMGLGEPCVIPIALNETHSLGTILLDIETSERPNMTIDVQPLSFFKPEVIDEMHKINLSSAYGRFGNKYFNKLKDPDDLKITKIRRDKKKQKQQKESRKRNR